MRPTKELKEISQINDEQKKTALELIVLQDELSHSMSKLNTGSQEYVSALKTDAVDFLVDKVILPAGALGLGWLFIKAVSGKKTVKVVPSQIKEIKQTIKSQPTVVQKSNTSVPQTKEKLVSHKSTSTPVVVKKKVKINRFKSWLPMALQVAKIGYSFYQNNYINDQKNPYSNATADRFMNPNPEK